MATKEEIDAVFAMLPPVFRKCTDLETVRFNLGIPAVANGWVYCTDGRIAIRGKSTPEIEAAIAPLRPTSNHPYKFPDMRAVFAGSFVSTGLPVPDHSDAPPCPNCAGTGVYPGMYCPDCGREIPAKDTTSPCRSCEGIGIKDARTEGVQIQAKGPWLSYWMLSILAACGATLYPSNEGAARSPVWFRAPALWTGVEGVVMPLDADAKEHLKGTVE